VSSESSCAVRLARHSQNAWARHVECVESSRVEPSGIWALLMITSVISTVPWTKWLRKDFTSIFIAAGIFRKWVSSEHVWRCNRRSKVAVFVQERNSSRAIQAGQDTRGNPAVETARCPAGRRRSRETNRARWLASAARSCRSLSRTVYAIVSYGVRKCVVCTVLHVQGGPKM